MPASNVTCLSCRSNKVYVVSTAQTCDEETVRRRACRACGFRWYTIQQPETPLPENNFVWQGSHGKPRWIKILRSDQQFH